MLMTSFKLQDRLYEILMFVLFHVFRLYYVLSVNDQEPGEEPRRPREKIVPNPI